MVIILRIVYISLFLLICSNVNSQFSTTYGEFIDDRDGKTYQTIKIGNTVWLAENMKYKTEGSENHEINDYGIDLDGYYYSYEDVDDVCPCGFRLPKTSDWEEYIQLLIEAKEIPASAIEFILLNKKGNESVGIDVSDDKLKIFEEPNPLNLKAHGHTQSGKIVAIGSMNIWIKHNNSTDPKYHLHLNSDGYGIHTHKHHIITRKKNLRKFSVRCVSDKAID